MGERETAAMPEGVRFGVSSPEEIAGRTGLEIIQAMGRGELPAPPISRTLQMWASEVADGRVVFNGLPSFDVYNPLGVVHGGWVLTLIDSACGCAAHTTLPAGVGYTTIETKANMIRPVTDKTGLVRCTGTVVARGMQIITAEARVETEGGKLLAHGTSTLMVLRPRTPATD